MASQLRYSHCLIHDRFVGDLQNYKYQQKKLPLTDTFDPKEVMIYYFEPIVLWKRN